MPCKSTQDQPDRIAVAVVGDEAPRAERPGRNQSGLRRREKLNANNPQLVPHLQNI